MDLGWDAFSCLLELIFIRVPCKKNYSQLIAHDIIKAQLEEYYGKGNKQIHRLSSYILQAWVS